MCQHHKQTIAAIKATLPELSPEQLRDYKRMIEKSAKYNRVKKAQ